MSFNQNIFLIGMMGSWKSTVGKKLSNELDLEFIDTDDEIEDATGESISEIFSNKGESQFREMESAFFVKKSKTKRIGNIYWRWHCSKRSKSICITKKWHHFLSSGIS